MIDFKQINELLKDLRAIRSNYYNNNSKFKLVSKSVVKEVNGEYSNQGEEGLKYEIYSTPY